MGCDNGTGLTLASLVRALKRHALDPSISDVAIMNGLIDSYVESERVKDRNGNPLSLDKSRVSRLLSGREDVPRALRAPLPRYGVIERTRSGLEPFVEEFIDGEDLGGLIHDLKALVEGDGSLSADAREGVLGTADEPIAFLAAIFIEALKADNRADSRVVIWSRGPNSLGLVSGNLLDFGFSNRSKRRAIVVVPVNTSFETHVTRKYEQSPTQVVADSTIHGQWLTRMEESGQADDLRNRIFDDLEARYGARQGSREGLKPYPIGSIAVIETNRAVFCLLAISTFDERNRATSSSEDISRAVADLLRFYDSAGQGLDMYLPLLGTGRSRAGLGYQQSLELIVGTCMDNRLSLLGKVTIVASEEAMKELSIEKIGEIDAL
ncbi:MAG: hypothetical protein IJI12_08075 [Atopobiaceae bacterium]|nr:hypothetical protein [Atopobiaceae bacterium]